MIRSKPWQARLRATSRMSKVSVSGRMVMVPGNPPWCDEPPYQIGGATSTPVRSATSSASVIAT
jgi:hypothetical protein